MAKKYFMEVDRIHFQQPFVDLTTYATLLSNMGDVCCDLGDLDEAIVYAQKAMQLWKKLPNSEHYIADNHKNIAIAYAEKNDFKNASTHFHLAIDSLKAVKGEEELLANIYGRLGNLYAVTFLNSNKASMAENFVLKGLEILNASKSYNNSKLPTQKLSCEVVRNKTRLGEVYNRLGRYKDAIKEGFDEGQYLIDNRFDNCLHNLTKARIFLGKGEANLRLGKLAIAENYLTSSLKLAEMIVGDGDSLKIKTYRTETYIRMGKLREAYEDCLAGFKLRKKRTDNHSKLLYAILFYHAAIIKDLKDENSASLEYFNKFFEEIKFFCQTYFTEKEFNTLIKDGIFKPLKQTENLSLKALHIAHMNSRVIFSKIFGNNHPFVQDYVIKNYYHTFQFG